MGDDEERTAAVRVEAGRSHDGGEPGGSAACGVLAKWLYKPSSARRLVFSIVFYKENKRRRPTAAGANTAMRRGFAPWADGSVRPLVRFEAVTKRFGGVVAVDGLSLDIYDVDVVAEAVQAAGIAKKVARLRPLGVIKG